MSHQFHEKKNSTKLLLRYFKDFIFNFSQIKSNLSNHKLLICFIAAPSDTLLSWCRYWHTNTRRRRKRQRENSYQTLKSKIKSNNLKSTIIVKYIFNTQGFIQIGWISSFYCLFWLFWTQTSLANKNYQYDPTDAAQYGALAPLLWSLSICWIVYACSNGCGDLINSFLSSKPLIVISKLSYAIFLIQFLIFFYTVGVTRDTETFKLSALLNRMEIVYMVFGALALTLFIDIPMQNLKRIIFPVIDESSTTETAGTTPVDDFKSPFDDRNEDDDFVVRSAFKSRQASAETTDSSFLKSSTNGRVAGSKDDSETESADNFWDRR
jgi:hypothetical protein